MIIATYSWVSPLLMPMGALFYSFSYLMYKYQLLYVYINKDQSGGFMWYEITSHNITYL
jgi:Calcium-dependent channel, 7TM region, putative phosphate